MSRSPSRWGRKQIDVAFKLIGPATLASLERQKSNIFAVVAQQLTDNASPSGPPTLFPPLEAVTSPTVDTAAAAHYLNRRPQTLRGWACAETWPEGLRPVRINGRLAWPVAGIKAVLGVCNEL